MAIGIRGRWGGNRAKAKRAAKRGRQWRSKPQRRKLLLQQLDVRMMLAADSASYTGELSYDGLTTYDAYYGESSSYEAVAFDEDVPSYDTSYYDDTASYDDTTSYDSTTSKAQFSTDTKATSEETSSLFYDTYSDFSLPELARWPEAPAVYDPDLAVLPAKPAELRVEAFPEPVSVQSVTPTVARNTHQNALAAARADYDQAVEDAQAEHAAAMAAATANHASAVAAAESARAAAIDGYSTQSLTLLQEAVADADAALQNEVERVTHAAERTFENRAQQLSFEQMEADQRSEATFQAASRAANEASRDRMSAIEERDMEAMERLSKGEISQAQYDATLAAIDADYQAERERLAGELSGLQETHENAVIDHAAIEAIERAKAQQGKDDTIARAGSGQAATLRQAKKNLANAVLANQYRLLRTEADANTQYTRDVAAANEIYTRAKTDADAARDTAYRIAAAQREKATANASYRLTRATANATAASIANRYVGNHSATAIYRIADADADRDAEIARARALLEQRHATIDANRDLDLTLIQAAADQANSAGTAAHVRDSGITDAAETFRTAYLLKMEQQATDAAGNETDAEARRDSAERYFGGLMAEVDKVRQVRDASELKSNRKATALARNRRDHGLISQSEYESEVAELTEQAEKKKIEIAQDTFGDANAPDPPMDWTESRTRKQFVAEQSAANSDLNDQKRQQKVDLIQFTAELSETRDADVAATEKDYQIAVSDARTASESTAISALGSWITEITAAQAEYEAALADATAVHTVAVAGATADFYTTATSEYASAVAAHAALDGDNPWSDQESAIASAEADRISAVARAYRAFVRTTATASAEAAGDAATARSTLVADTTLAILEGNAAAQSASASYQTRIAEADELHVNLSSSSLSIYDVIVSDENKAWKETKDEAEVRRMGGYFTALLSYAHDIIPGLDVAGAAQADRRELEAEFGISYATTVINAEKSYLAELANAKKTLHNLLASVRTLHAGLTTDAAETLGLDLGEAKETAEVDVSRARAASMRSMTRIITDYDTQKIDSNHTLALAISAADRDYAKAVAAADAALDVAVVNRDRNAVAGWAAANVDANGQMTPHARHSLDVYDAALNWQSDAAPVIQAYRESIADELDDLRIAYANANKTVGFDRVDADRILNRATADAFATFQEKAAAADRKQSDALVRADAAFSRAVAEFDRIFAGAFFESRGNLAFEYAEKSTLAEAVRADDRTELHKKEISQSQYDRRWDDNRDSLAIALAVADRDFAHARADAVEVWGNDIADEQRAQFTDKADAAKRRHNAIATDYWSAQRPLVDAMQTHTTDLANSEATFANSLARAERDFDNAAASAWTTALSSIGDFDVVRARAVAQAEADHHVRVATAARDQRRDDFGMNPDRSQRFVLRVLNARVSFLNDVSDDFVTLRGDTAQHSADANLAGADAEEALQEHLGRERVLFITRTESALDTATSTVAANATEHTVALLRDMVSWVDSTVSAAYKQQETMADAYQSGGRRYAMAEAFVYRKSADRSLAIIRDQHGQRVNPSDVGDPTALGGYLDRYNRHAADTTYRTGSASARSKGTYASSIAAAEQTHVENVADAEHRATTAEANAQYRFDATVAAAVSLYSTSAASAYREYDEAIAQASRDHVVDDTEAILTAILAQYTAARDAYRSFDDILDVTVQHTIAEVQGAYHYAKSLVPDYLEIQTAIADANLDYANTVINSLEIHRGKTTMAVLAHAFDAAIDNRFATNDRSDAWVTAVKTGAEAQSTFDQASAGAVVSYKETMAILQLESVVNAGWQGFPTLDTSASSAAAREKNERIHSASQSRDSEIASARDAYFGALANLDRETEYETADRDHRMSIALINSLADLKEDEINAEFTARSAEVNAKHDFRIADIDAVIAGLTAVRHHFVSDATILTMNQARSMRSQRIAEVNEDRRVAHDRVEKTRDDALADVQSEKADAIDEADSEQQIRHEKTDVNYRESTAPGANDRRSLPTIETYDAIDLGVTASAAPFLGKYLTLVDRATSSLTFGNDDFTDGSPGSPARTVGAVADGLYDRTGWGSVADMGRFVVSAQSQWIGDTIRMLPSPEQLVEFGSQSWALHRQQNASDAGAVRDWGAATARNLEQWGNTSTGKTGFLLGFVGGALGRYLESGSNLFAALGVDPYGTAEGLVQSIEAHYSEGGGGFGGVLAATGMLTDTMGFYEAYTGVDFLTGDQLTDDEKFDRVWMSTSSTVTNVATLGSSGLLKNFLQNGVKGALRGGAKAPLAASTRGFVLSGPEAKIADRASAGITGLADDLLRTGDDALDAQVLALRDELRHLSVHSPTDKALFWSGDIEKAHAFALREGLTTLEMTEAGKYLTNHSLSRKISAAVQFELWEELSSRFAHSISGQVTVLRSHVTSASVFSTIEHSILWDRYDNGVSQILIIR